MKDLIVIEPTIKILKTESNLSVRKGKTTQSSI